MKRPGLGASLASALVLAVLVGLPLLGLGSALVKPPEDPLGGQVALSSVLASSGVGELLLRSLALSAVVAVVATAWGAGLAWGSARLEFPGRRVLDVLALLPLAMPSYLLAATLAQGPLPRVRGLPAAALVLVLVTVPYVQLIVGAALARGSAAEEEAARSLGAGPWRVFRVVVLPRLRPALGLSALICALYAISDFGAVAVLDAPVLTWRLFQAVQGQALAKAAILGGATLAATLPLFVLARLLRGSDTLREAANPRPPARTPARGGVLALTWLGFGAIVLLGLALPVWTLVSWVVEGLQRGAEFAAPWSALGQTAAVSLVAAAVLVLLAGLPARTVGMGRARGLDEAVFVSSALPGVLLAFGLMLAALALARLAGGRTLYAWMLGSGVLLMLGYGARYLAETYAPMRAAWARVDPRLGESARVLGVGRARWLARVELPMVAPGVAAAAVLAFLAVLKELPVTLLLGGAMGLHTLAFRVWDRYREALWQDAGVSGLLLVGLALVLVVATLRWRRHA